ncbi:CASP-like protein 1D1 [Tasmannia lanceolata]|uniref:CASP-like protein 1D1 n=1 Tax=Tasmannia lanceolata TaxID=3420 RepID=UPI0040641118
MDSNDLTHDSGKTVPESQVIVTTPPINLFMADFSLRLLLFASTVVGIVVMVTSKQTEYIMTPLAPFPIPNPAKFRYSPAFIYLVVALSVTGLYSLLSLTCSAFAISKPSPSTTLLFLFAIMDALMAGILASATGAATSIAYVGLRGNSHVGWMKICNVYDKFCRHVGSSIGVSIFASIILVLLVMISAYSLYRRSR